MSADIVCREVLELLSSYLDGALPADTTAAVEAHLALCDGCTSVLEEFRRTIALTGQLHEEHVTPSQRDLLLRTFRDWVAD
jgi:anti-sigma factor RsiW